MRAIVMFMAVRQHLLPTESAIFCILRTTYSPAPQFVTEPFHNYLGVEWSCGCALERDVLGKYLASHASQFPHTHLQSLNNNESQQWFHRPVAKIDNDYIVNYMMQT